MSSFFNKSIKLIDSHVKQTASIKISLQLSNYAKKFMIKMKKELHLFYVPHPLLTDWETLNTHNEVLTAKLLRQGYVYRYHKIPKAFSKFYRRHFDIVSKAIQNLQFMATLVYNDFTYHFKKIIVR